MAHLMMITFIIFNTDFDHRGKFFQSVFFSILPILFHAVIQIVNEKQGYGGFK